MRAVGLTGGIGSGKTTIGNWFEEKGISVYNSDLEAKRLMNENPEIIQELSHLFGPETYINGIYNSKFVASKVFNDKALLEKLNRTVHPAVFKDFQNWKENQTSLFVVKEAAILFESGSYKDFDWIVSVVADEQLRIIRVQKRDNSEAEEIQKRINKQWTDEQRIAKSDFVIFNNSDLEELRQEFDKVYNKLLKHIRSS